MAGIGPPDQDRFRILGGFRVKALKTVAPGHTISLRVLEVAPFDRLAIGAAVLVIAALTWIYAEALFSNINPVLIDDTLEDTGSRLDETLPPDEDSTINDKRPEAGSDSLPDVEGRRPQVPAEGTPERTTPLEAAPALDEQPQSEEEARPTGRNREEATSEPEETLPQDEARPTGDKPAGRLGIMP